MLNLQLFDYESGPLLPGISYKVSMRLDSNNSLRRLPYHANVVTVQ